MAPRSALVLLFTLAAPGCIEAARVKKVKRTTAPRELPAETVTALQAWMADKTYRYVIVEVPKLDKPLLGPPSANYGDFYHDLLACKGVCLGAYDFEWKAPRGSGTVDITEPAMFSYAPDDVPEGLTTMKYIRLKMEMANTGLEAFKKSIKFDGAYIQVTHPGNLDPEWVVSKLKGGRMGTRLALFDEPGVALHTLLTKELAQATGAQPLEPPAADNQPAANASAPSTPSPTAPKQPKQPTKPKEPTKTKRPTKPEEPKASPAEPSTPAAPGDITAAARGAVKEALLAAAASLG